MLDASTFNDLQTASALARDDDQRQCYGIGWAVAATQPQAERRAADLLRHQGYQTRLPLHTVRIRDRAIPTLWHPVQRPIWPGYLFVWHDSRNPWRPIRETPGVKHLVHSGGNIGYARAGALEAVEAALAQAATNPLASRSIAPGGAVVVTTGAFAAHRAVVIAVSADRALVSILMFGQLREIQLSLDALASED